MKTYTTTILLKNGTKVQKQHHNKEDIDYTIKIGDEYRYELMVSSNIGYLEFCKRVSEVVEVSHKEDDIPYKLELLSWWGSYED